MINQYLNHITHADCMDILPKLPNKCIDLVLTDPPYGMVNRESNGLRNLDKGVADIVEFDLNEWLDQISACAKAAYTSSAATNRFPIYSEN